MSGVVFNFVFNKYTKLHGCLRPQIQYGFLPQVLNYRLISLKIAPTLHFTHIVKAIKKSAFCPQFGLVDPIFPPKYLYLIGIFFYLLFDTKQDFYIV